MQKIKTDHEEFEEPEYPAYPVVFQRDLDGEFGEDFKKQQSPSQPALKQFHVPQEQANQLFRLTKQMHQTKYSQFFSESIENKANAVQLFFQQYCPIDFHFVQQMKKDIKRFSMTKLSSNSIIIGQFINQKCNGKCIIIFRNGNLYEGQMIDNKRQGQGTYINSNLGWYRGQFKDDVKNGQGIQVIYNKNAYKGTFLNGLRHQKGLYVDFQDNIYEGMWKLGIMHGKGTLKSALSIYCGNFTNWLKHGTGEQNFTNGDFFQGEYQNGRFDGIGTYQWQDGAIYQGSFKNGLRHGKGKWHKGQIKYNGSYVEGLKEAYGELYFASGNFYKGSFIQDKKQGYGEMFWTDTSFYKGDWKSGTQNGKGQIYLVGGEIMSGIFQKGIMVQGTPSLYEKQLEMSNLTSQSAMFGDRIQDNYKKKRTFSDTKGFSNKKKLAKIEQNPHRHHKKQVGGSIHQNIYFKSPHKSDHSDGACGTCARRLQKFRLKQQTKRFNNVSVRINSKNDEL